MWNVVSGCIHAGNWTNRGNRRSAASECSQTCTVTGYTGHTVYNEEHNHLGNCCVHPNPLPTPIPVSVCLTHWLFLAQNRVLSSRGPGFRSYLTLLATIHHLLHPSLPASFSPPVTQLWPCAAHENSHQIILTKHQHLLPGDTHFITHSHTHTNANTLICIKKVSSASSYWGTRADVAAGRKESLMHCDFTKWKLHFYLFTAKYAENIKETCCRKQEVF